MVYIALHVEDRHGGVAGHLAAADEALYEAKREGRDKVRRAGLKLIKDTKAARG